MPWIGFSRKKFPAFEVETGITLMQALVGRGVPVASSCRGDGVCGKCALRVSSSSAGLSEPNDLEVFLKEKNGIETAKRISCQALVLGDVEVDASYW